MDDIDQTSSEYGMVVNDYTQYQQSFHENKKKTISFRAILIQSNFRYRIGFELELIKVDNNYTVSIEQLFNVKDYWEKSVVSMNGNGISIHFIHAEEYEYVINNVNYYYTKTIVQITKLTAPSHFLYYTTHIDNISNPPSGIDLHMVVYGVNGLFHNVDESVNNGRNFLILNEKIRPQKEIDMNNKK